MTLGRISIIIVELKQEITVSINYIDCLFSGPLFEILPVTVIVKTPALVGGVQDIVLVSLLKAINDISYSGIAYTSAEY